MSISYHEGRLAYVFTPANESVERRPAIMFLGGFRSDMSGTKAIFLEGLCKAQGRAFMRFDYSGHGLSKGRFEDGTIGSWTQDAAEILALIPQEKVILVGSSMGGWISLNLLLKSSKRIDGVIGIAAAPDFTQEIWPRMTNKQKEEMDRDGFIAVPSGYGPEPYIYTKALIEDGERNLLLDKVHKINVPLLLLQGKKDTSVPWKTAEKIKSCFIGPRSEVFYIEDGDHRLSRAEDLEKLEILLSGL